MRYISHDAITFANYCASTDTLVLGSVTVMVLGRRWEWSSTHHRRPFQMAKALTQRKHNTSRSLSARKPIKLPMCVPNTLIAPCFVAFRTSCTAHRIVVYGNRNISAAHLERLTRYLAKPNRTHKIVKCFLVAATTLPIEWAKWMKRDDEQLEAVCAFTRLSALELRSEWGRPMLCVHLPLCPMSISLLPHILCYDWAQPFSVLLWSSNLWLCIHFESRSVWFIQ